MHLLTKKRVFVFKPEFVADITAFMEYLRPLSDFELCLMRYDAKKFDDADVAKLVDAEIHRRANADSLF